MTDATKRALAESLKRVLEEKPLDRITIADLTNDCGVNRQTFYYHYHDIYDLIEYIYLTEGGKALAGKSTYSTWQEGIRDIFGAMIANKSFVQKTFYSRSREHLEKILLQSSHTILMQILHELTEDNPLEEGDLLFISRFYEHAFVGIVMDWIRNGMNPEPEIMIEKLDNIVQGNLVSAVEKYSK